MSTFPFMCRSKGRRLVINLSYHINIRLSLVDAPPHSLKDSNGNSKVKTMEEEGVGVRFLAHNTSKVEGRVGVPRWGLK
jgi:hypothetical protein